MFLLLILNLDIMQKLLLCFLFLSIIACSSERTHAHYFQQKWIISVTPSGIAVNDTCNCYIRLGNRVKTFKDSIQCFYTTKDSLGNVTERIITEHDLFPEKYPKN